MEKVEDDLNVTMHYAAAQAHVPEAEWNNRTIKERVRATYHRLPYKALSKAILGALVTWSCSKA